MKRFEIVGAKWRTKIGLEKHKRFAANKHEKYMPYIKVKITKDETSVAQKKQIVEEMTQTLVKVLGKKPEHIHTVIDEVEPENWGFAGLLTTEYRKEK